MIKTYKIKDFFGIIYKKYFLQKNKKNKKIKKCLFLKCLKK